MEFLDYLDKSATLVDSELRRLLAPGAGIPPRLSRAMEYALFSGGKRLRPAMLFFTNEMFCVSPGAPAAAAAVEMVHTYSLVHDDLPAMDDDDIRRGKPTVHVEFDEAMAILVGDALLTLAFETLASTSVGLVDGATAARLALELSRAAGPASMVAGQVLDMEAAPDTAAAPGAVAKAVERIHELKTARMFCASVRMGAILGNASEEDIETLTEYALHFGALYQASDDLQDFAAQDSERRKVTYPAVCGVEATRRRIEEQATRALESVTTFGDRGWWLRGLVNYVKSR